MGDVLVKIVTVVAVIAIAGGVFVGLNRLVDTASARWRDRIRPWVFVGPALVFLGVGLVYPLVRTVYLSLRGGRNGGDGFTFDNYRNVFTDDRYFSLDGWADIFTTRLFMVAVVLALIAAIYVVVIRQRAPGTGIDVRAPVPSIALVIGAICILLAVFSTLEGTVWNNLWWVASVTGLSTVIGLALAIMADRSKGENVAKSLIFLPMAISFVGAAVIWRYVYYRNTPRGHRPAQRDPDEARGSRMSRSTSTPARTSSPGTTSSS